MRGEGAEEGRGLGGVEGRGRHAAVGWEVCWCGSERFEGLGVVLRVVGVG